MFGGIIPYPAGRGKDEDGRSGREQVEEAERAQVHLSCAVDGAGETYGTGRYSILQVVLPQYGCQRGQVEDHDNVFFFLASREKSLSSCTMVLLRMPSPSTSSSI